MPELRIYPRHEIPRDYACQIRSYTRVQWPGMSMIDPRKIWDDVPRPGNWLHFLLVEGEILVSHAAINHRPVEFQGQTLNVYGLSTVFTYPDYRKGGHARQVVQAATDRINSSSDADLAMLFCGHPLRHFYTSCGWVPMDTARIYFGDKASPTLKNDNLVMMLFVSDRGRRAGTAMEKDSVYVGPLTW